MDAAEALEVLGVREGSDLAGVRAAYRGLLRSVHPDVARDDADAHARTAQLTEAYEVIVAFVEAHGALPVPAPPDPPAPPPPPTPAPADHIHHVEPAVQVATLDEGTIALDAPAPEAYGLLVEAAGRVGEVAYYDRRLGILEIIVRFEGGPSCSVVMTLQGRAHHTEVFCTMESIESTPAPPIAPVIDALVAALREL